MLATNLSQLYSDYDFPTYQLQTRRHDRDEGCSVVTIGNGWKGISVYFEGKEDKDRLHLPWKSVAKLSFRRDKFHITYTNPGLEVCECGMYNWSQIRVPVYRLS